VPSDAASRPPDDAAEQFRQTALLLADLGRYDEAAGELAAGLAVVPEHAGLLTTLARVHLAADQPAAALTASERAAASAPDTIGPLVVRAMALADSRRFGEAAEICVQVLQRWPDDPYAQRTGAALLSETRNGQQALNAAWGAVSLAPRHAEAHLVLGVVSARLRLFGLAQRAYGEALELDPALGEAQRDLGVVRLERRRWAKALEELADAAALAAPTPSIDAPSGPGAIPTGPMETGRVYPGQAGALPPLTVSRPAGPVLDPAGDSAHSVRRAVRYGAHAVLVAGLLTALMTTASTGASRVWAATIGVIILAVVGGWLRRQLTEPVATVLARHRRQDRRLAWATWAAFCAPLLLVAYGLVGGLAAVVAAMVVAAGADLLVLTRRS
jgi:tetratricopeptide (TPR) repeat protein